METRTRSGFIEKKVSHYTVWLSKAGTNADFLVKFYESNLEASIKRAEEHRDELKQSYGMGILKEFDTGLWAADCVLNGQLFQIVIENEYLKGFFKPETINA